MRVPRINAPAPVAVAFRVWVIARWLVESLIQLLVGWVRFLFATRRGLVVGVLLTAIFVAADEALTAQGSPAFNQLSQSTQDVISILELFFVAVSMRVVSGLRKPGRRAGWTQFLGSWAVGGSAIILLSIGLSQLASTAHYSTGTLQLLGAGGVALALLGAGAISNWSALGEALSADRTRAAARSIRARILNVVGRRALQLPEGAAYSSWYAWSVCAMAVSPAAAHRAAEAAVTALRAGADGQAAAAAAMRSRWTPAGIVERVRSMGSPA